MDKILERIMDTDRTAREKVNDRRRRLETINDEIVSAREQIDSELSGKVRTSVENTRKETDKKRKAKPSVSTDTLTRRKKSSTARTRKTANAG